MVVLRGLTRTVEPPMSTEKQKFTFSVKEAAQAMGIGYTLMRKMLKERKIASVKIGKRVVITPQAIQDFLARSECQVETESA